MHIEFHNDVVKKIIMAALWTEVCLMYPALDLFREGYEVYAVSDASGGTTIDAHERGMQRLVQAGAVPITWEAAMAAKMAQYASETAQEALKMPRERSTTPQDGFKKGHEAPSTPQGSSKRLPEGAQDVKIAPFLSESVHF